MSALPRLMVAPNGATKTKADHPALPVTLDEILATARACFDAGADGLHLHLRTAEGGHLLDTGAYREALVALRAAVPEMALQITTEAAGLYHAGHQRHVALNSGADLVSAAVREIVRDGEAVAARFYAECAERGIAVQHILYDVDDAARLARLLPAPLLRAPDLQLLFVLGRYTAGQVSSPAMLHPFLDWLNADALSPDWMVCAFGRGETDCLQAAQAQGGKARVGFENSFEHADGRRAADNAERVAAVAAALTGG